LTAERYDVVVVSGSSGGVGAAVGAGRLGMRVALVEDTPTVGGMLASGISNIDTFSFESLSGLFEEFRQRVQEHYRPLEATDPIFRAAPHPSRHVDGRSRQANDFDRGGRWEPHVADRLFKEILAELPNVTVLYNRAAVDVVKVGRRVVGVVTERLRGSWAHAPIEAGDRRVLLGRVVVDATHEADVAAWAGAPYRVGREARSPLEPHAGEIRFFNQTGEIMPGSSGRQDRAVVSYGLRLTVKRHEPAGDLSHMLAEPPPGYDRHAYAAHGYRGRQTMPNGKAEVNANPIGNELQELNWAWPEASREERGRLAETYRNHALGFLYFLQREGGMPELGLPSDEYVDNGNVPYRVFVREARRIEGEATMTEADVNPFVLGNGLIPPLRTDSVAVGHYAIDSKPVQSKTDLSTPDKGAGDFFIANPMAPFQVPYGAIVPKQVDGLLVPVGLSATHVAFSAVRMDPTWTVTGQAAGIAAALSVRARCRIRDVDLPSLQRELIRQRCRLMFYWDLPLDHPAFGAIQWLSVRGVVRGYPDRLVRPDQPLTRAELAALLVRWAGLWPSVSEVHFTDLPHHHWAFREVETLHDRGALAALGVEPLWPSHGGYDWARHQGFSWSGPQRAFVPEAPATWRELTAALRDLVEEPDGAEASDWAGWAEAALGRSELGQPYVGATREDGALTRGGACALLAALSDAAPIDSFADKRKKEEGWTW
jgi:ribulose 1,5-bisphosphate synthetase/thiazole synthase